MGPKQLQPLLVRVDRKSNGNEDVILRSWEFQVNTARWEAPNVVIFAWLTVFNGIQWLTLALAFRPNDDDGKENEQK